MHELATTRNIVRICEQAAAEQGGHRVTEIRLRIGALTGIVPECLRDFFPYASKGTVCEGAELICEEIPALIRCSDCGYEGAAKGWDCPRCGGWSFRIVEGREFFVDSIAVE